MSRREVVDCDRCGKESSGPVKVHLETGWSPCPAGGRSEPDTERLDFCPGCAAWAFGQVASKLDHAEASSLVAKVKAERKKFLAGDPR